MSSFTSVSPSSTGPAGPPMWPSPSRSTSSSTHFAALIFWRIRRAPRRWWLQSWIIAAFCVVFWVVVTPVIIDPLFNKFEPLAQTDPTLVAQLEQVVARSGMSIPPSRIFLMRASAKTNETNAYVTGFGASKRVVVWDTTIKTSPPDEISFLFGHEMGHYVLRHILRGIVFSVVMIFFGFWSGRRILAVCASERAGASRLQTMWLALSFLRLSSRCAGRSPPEPIGNAFSRSIEHAADAPRTRGDPRIPSAPTLLPRFAHAASSASARPTSATPERRPFAEWWLYNRSEPHRRPHRLRSQRTIRRPPERIQSILHGKVFLFHSERSEDRQRAHCADNKE